ncbi:MAG: DNA polymerase III subunit gamma/tau [Deltaproteobacteria bacterium]|nr:DNA polymerase III subunit gamma/tau [Deltaproteobacteria bacterium]
MSYLVLARKWRPQQLQEILGQDHVTRTLTNALASGRIAHAFLFTGARGVGKTSAARILAKALCCERGSQPTPTPCGECSACLEIAEGRATDVFEIDAASNTGVANVREIIDNVRYLPSKTRFKIYIIDEVHMLSTGAFNALLKTLEEPPPHVKFILATTDVHKVPVTILSRCQRYDFRRIALGKVAERLSAILAAEGIEHDPSALYAVARESEGSMRDAQSILEQVLTYADGTRLDGSRVREALGVADQAVLDEVIAALLGRQPGRVIELVKDVHDRGLDLARFAGALVELVRDLLLARLLADPRSVLDRPSDEITQLVQRAKEIDPQSLERLFDRLAEIVETVAESPFPRYALEVHLASLAEAPPRVDLEALVKKLDRLEGALAAQSTPATVAPGGAASRPFRAPELRADPTSPAVRQDALPVSSPPVSSLPGSSLPGSPLPVSPLPVSPPPGSPPPLAPPPGSPPPPPVSLPRDGASFSDFVAVVRKKRPSLSSLLQVRPLAFGAGAVELGCETSFDESQLTHVDTKRFLEGVLAELFGRPTELRVRRIAKGEAPAAPAEAAPMPATLSEAEEAERAERRADKIRDAKDRPAVRALMQELGASVAKVRPVDES